MAGKIGVREISQQGFKVIFKLWDNVKISQAVMASLVANYGEKIMINGGENPFIRLTAGREEPLDAINTFLETALSERKLN